MNFIMMQHIVYNLTDARQFKFNLMVDPSSKVTV